MRLRPAIIAHTNGRGLWSREARPVKIIELDFKSYDDDDYVLVDALFSKWSWNAEKHGLIYTDNLWLKEFKQGLLKLGFSKGALSRLDYTEQGMQGDDFVSLQGGPKFKKEAIELGFLD